ncbi:hypothetical protein HK102_004851, partial [Quaeritorhiza haematococci]
LTIAEVLIITILIVYTLRNDKQSSFRIDRWFHVCVFTFAAIIGTAIGGTIATSLSARFMFRDEHDDNSFWHLWIEWFGGRLIGYLLMTPLSLTVVTALANATSAHRPAAERLDGSATRRAEGDCRKRFMAISRQKYFLIKGSLLICYASIIVIPILITVFTNNEWHLKAIVILAPTFPFIIIATAMLNLIGGALGIFLIGISQQLFVIFYANDGRKTYWGPLTLLEYSICLQIYMAISIFAVFATSLLVSARDEALRELKRTSRERAEEMAHSMAKIKLAQEKAEQASSQKSKFIAFM